MKPTTGKWDFRVKTNTHGGWRCPETDVTIFSGGTIIAAYSTGYAEYPANDKENEANASLMADAGNTYHATGLTPSELAAQREELLAALQHAEEILYELGAESETVKSAITNATKGEK